jgi:hypothetical protein
VREGSPPIAGNGADRGIAECGTHRRRFAVDRICHDTVPNRKKVSIAQPPFSEAATKGTFAEDCFRVMSGPRYDAVVRALIEQGAHRVHVER